MAKDLFIVRHAHAEFSRLGDFFSPLSEIGQMAAKESAAALANYATPPQAIVCSPAIRALTTAEIFAATWGLDNSIIKTDKRIYDLLYIDKFADVLLEHFPRQQQIVLIGHNPSMSMLYYSCTTLEGENKVPVAMTPASMVHLHFDDATDWRWESISKASSYREIYPAIPHG